MKKADIKMDNLPDVNRRFYEFIINEFGSVYAFCKKTGLSQPRINSLFHISKKTNDYPTIQSDIIEIVAKGSNIDLNWIYRGHDKDIDSDISGISLPKDLEVPNSQEEDNVTFEALMKIISTQEESFKVVVANLKRQVEDERELRNKKLAELEKYILFQNDQLKLLIDKMNYSNEKKQVS